jgi:ech hydrogenase subunit A
MKVIKLLLTAYSLVLFPVVVGLVFLISKKTLYKPLACLLSVVCTILTLIVLIKGPNRFEISGELYTVVEAVIIFFEAAIAIYFIYVSIRHKRFMVLTLSLLQLCVLIYTIVFSKGEHSAFINIDKLSIVMLAIINVIGTLIIVFANGYMNIYEHHRHMKSRQRLFYFVVAGFIGAMNALVICDSLSWVLFFWEVTTLVSFILISYNQDEEAHNSGFRALGINLIGGLAFAVGNILLSSQLDITTLSELSQKGALSGINLIPIFLLCIAGFAKSAQFPFQSWLLGAMVAPTPVSALLHSSTMVKAGVFLIIKLSPAYANTWLGTAIAMFGGFCFLVCAAIAISQSNAKRVLAYSTISNLGLIICTAGMGTAMGVSAAIILLIFHAISKALLFLTTGQTEHVINSRNIDDMTGLIKVSPGLTLIMAFGIISMILPPFGVLVTKWLSIEASAVNPPLLIFLAFGSAFTNVYYIRWISAILSAPIKKLGLSKAADKTIYMPLIILCLSVIITSIGMAPIYNELVSPEVNYILHENNTLAVNGGKVISEFGTFNNTLVLATILVIIAVYAVIKYVVAAPVKIKSIYMCGENNLEADNQDSFRSFDGSSVHSEVSNLYLEKVFNEQKLNYFGYIISGLVLMGMLIGGLL